MRPRIVIDTNVFTSAILSRRGASYRLIGMVAQGDFEVELSVPLVLEYEAVGKRVLSRSGLTAQELEAILDFMCLWSNHREVYYKWRPCLKDPSDDMVLELAVAAGGATIVTFDHDDFRGAEQFGVRVLSPQQFLHELRSINP